MSDQKDDPSKKYAEFRKLEIKTKLDTTMFTLVHTCAVADLFLLKWLVSRQLNNIFVCGIKYNTDEVDDDRREEVHKSMFDMSLTYDVEIKKSSANSDELLALEAMAKKLIANADNNTTGGELNIITLIKPHGHFVSALWKSIRASTSNVKHVVVINSNDKCEELANPPCHMYYVSADHMIYGSSAQKIIEAGTESDNHKGAIAMIKFIENVSLNPMFNIFAYMHIAKTKNIEQWSALVNSEVNDDVGNMEHGYTSKLTEITIESMDDAAAALSYFIQGMLIDHTTY